jgi:hypothetical protein
VIRAELAVRVEDSSIDVPSLVITEAPTCGDDVVPGVPPLPRADEPAVFDAEPQANFDELPRSSLHRAQPNRDNFDVEVRHESRSSCALRVRKRPQEEEFGVRAGPPDGDVAGVVDVEWDVVAGGLAGHQIVARSMSQPSMRCCASSQRGQ